MVALSTGLRILFELWLFRYVMSSKIKKKDNMKYLRCEDLFEYGDKVCSAEHEMLMVSVLELS